MITELDVSALPSAWGLTAEITASHDYDEKYNLMKPCAKAVWRLAQQTAEKKSKNGK